MDISSIEIVNGSKITLHFSLTLRDGEVIDSNFDKSPVSFQIGDGNMLPGFERLLLGLTEGDRLEKLIEAAEAFGERNPKNVQHFPIERFSHLLEDELMPAEQGSVVAFKDGAGFDVPGVVDKILDDTIVVDFNHPLSGRDILFKALIIKVNESNLDVLEVKL